MRFLLQVTTQDTFYLWVERSREALNILHVLSLADIKHEQNYLVCITYAKKASL